MNTTAKQFTLSSLFGLFFFLFAGWLCLLLKLLCVCMCCREGATEFFHVKYYLGCFSHLLLFVGQPKWEREDVGSWVGRSSADRIGSTEIEPLPVFSFFKSCLYDDDDDVHREYKNVPGDSKLGGRLYNMSIKKKTSADKALPTSSPSKAHK